MSDSSDRPEQDSPRDAPYWAQPVSRLKVSGLPVEAVDINVEGCQVVGPLQGFGQLWQKTYWVRLSGATSTPAEVIETWKQSFSQFWPEGNRFYAPLTGIAPGEAAVLDISTGGGMRLSTGVMVIYADEESFTFMNPEGHMFSGWITFSSHERDEATVAQVQVLVRANDPIYEIGMRLFGFKKEDAFWMRTLESLAAHFNVQGQAQMSATCVDPRYQWSQAKNVWHNAAIRSALYAPFAPLRLVQNMIRRR